ncbi:MAG: GNAT family N-acetyltransferase [Nitriliruptorales bacterium]
MPLEVRPVPPGDHEVAHALRVQALSGRHIPYHAERPQPVPGRDVELGAYDGGRLVATVTAWEFGQWFGRREVPMGAVTGVAVAPDRRGSGAGGAAMRALLPAMRELGFAVSTLYPSTARFYRGMGWEIAGVWSTAKVKSRSLAEVPPPTDTTVRPASLDERETLVAVYDRAAPDHAGWLGRRGAWWDLAAWRARRDEDTPRHVYVAERAGEPVGFIRYEHTTEDPQAYGLKVEDLVALDRDGIVALLRLLGSNRTMTATIELRSGLADPLFHLLPEQDLQPDFSWRWMTRLLDAPAAIAARGYSPSIAATVPIELVDPLAEWNAGRWTLEVSGGEGKLTPGGDGHVRLTVGALSTLYTGWTAPRQLAALGLLEGATAADLDQLAAAFAGPLPWCPDFF